MWKTRRIFMKRFRGEVTDDKILRRDLVNVDWMDFKQAKGYLKYADPPFCRRSEVRFQDFLIGEFLQFHIIGGDVGQGGPGDEADQFGFQNIGVTASGLFPDTIEDGTQRRYPVIREIHGYLGHAPAS
jgi:hypothetical protein